MTFPVRPAGRRRSLSGMGTRLTGWLLSGSLFVSASGAAQTGTSSSPAASQPPEERPYSIERIKEKLEEEPPLLSLNLEGVPVFRLEVIERRPRSFDLPNQFDIPWRPRPAFTSWHNEFLTMVTPEEVRPFSPMYTNSEMAQLVGTSLASLGVIELATAAVHRLQDARRRAREAGAREEVDEALREFERQHPQ